MRLRDLYRDRAVWLYGALTAAFFYKPLTTQTFFFRDLYQCAYPRKVILGAALRAGTFPLWDPFTNGGQPYLAMPTYTAMHPSNVLYAFLPPIVAFNLIPVLHVFLCAVAAYWLGRVVGLTRPAAFVSGLAFAFAGVTLSTTNLVGWLLALPWIPLTIGLTHRALRDGRSIVPATVAAAMPLVASMPEPAALLFATVIVWVVSTPDKPARRVRVIAILIAGAIGLSLFATLPATSVIRQSSRAAVTRNFESFTSWSIHPRRLPELIVPGFFGRTDTLDEAAYRGRQWETLGFPLLLSIYFGVPLLILACFGARAHPALAALAAGALLLSMGRYVPGFHLLYEIPLVTLFRYPSKILVLMLLPVALLAGYGVERITRRQALISAGIALAILAAIAPFAIRDVPMSFAHAAIAAIALSLSMFVRRRDLAIAAIVTVDLLVASWKVNAYAPREIFDEPPLAAAVRAAIGPLRFYAPPRPLVVRAPTNDIRWLAQSQVATLSEQTPVMFGIPVIFHQDYDGLAPRATSELARMLWRTSWPKAKPLLDAAGVRAFLTLDDVRLPGVHEIGRVDTPSGPLHLYVNEGAYAARFEGPCPGGRARILRRDLNSARYEADAPCDGRVVFSENHYDGWRATLDGREVPHMRARYAFTSVAVKKGHHVIERRYFPPRFVAGMIGSLLAALVLLAARMVERRASAHRLVPAG